MTEKQIESSSIAFKTRKDLSSWEKAYWFLRVLVDTNRFGALARDTKRLSQLKDNLFEAYCTNRSQKESHTAAFEILLSILNQTLLDKVNETSKKYIYYMALYEELITLIKLPEDIVILIYVIEDLLLPTNEAIKNVPTFECTDFAKKYFKAILDVKGVKGLTNIIRDWDIMTEDVALNLERDILINLYSSVKNTFKDKLLKFELTASPNDLDIVLTSLCQEYEKKSCSKRKQRAGKDLEGAVQFILDYFKFKQASSPEHFTTGLEVDNWLRDKKGWYIGISLKRTLRERWKQTYTTELGLYDRYKIKYIIHIINNDFDLSDSKISELGSYRHLFFISDDSKLFNSIKDHVVLGKYLFPMSELIDQLNRIIKD